MSVTGACFNCKKTASDEFFCFGCLSYICDDCSADWSIADAKMGSHNKKDHLFEAEIDEEEEP